MDLQVLMGLSYSYLPLSADSRIVLRFHILSCFYFQSLQSWHIRVKLFSLYGICCGCVGSSRTHLALDGVGVWRSQSHL